MGEWYSTQVVFPEPNIEIIWIASDGREVVGMYDGKDGWYTLDGGYPLCTPLRWRYADGVGPSLSFKWHNMPSDNK